jgi:hypothetical protein
MWVGKRKQFFFKFARYEKRAGWPDWSNFRTLGGCFLWSFFLITEVAQILRLFFPQYKLQVNLDKKWVGRHFRRFFSWTHLATGHLSWF